jgi:hypothetical protein
MDVNVYMELESKSRSRHLSTFLVIEKKKKKIKDFPNS